MTSVAERKRRRKARNEAKRAQSGDISPAQREVETVAGVGAKSDNKPTREASMHGSYIRAEDSRTAPWVNRHVDMIARLGADGLLSPAQVEAARLWQEIHAAYLEEIGVAQGRSCLNISAGGFDGGDGNPATIQAYYGLLKRLGAVHSARLGIEVGKGASDKPDNLDGLQRALNAMND